MSVVADDLVREFETTASVMGLLGSMDFYCSAVMQFPAGLLADFLGPRRTVTIFLAVTSAGSLGLGLAPNVSVASAGRIVVGLGVSVVYIPTIKILSQWFRAREFALTAGMVNAVGGRGRWLPPSSWF
jgi:MFS family permease